MYQEKKKKPLDHWFYVSGIVENVFVMFTGASKTLISEEVYKKITEDTRPKLLPAASQRSVHNLSLQEYYKAVFEVKLEREKLQQEVVVGNISDEG